MTDSSFKRIAATLQKGLVLLILILGFQGCSVQKRLYTGGYYREHHSPVNTAETPGQNPAIQDTEPVLTASASKNLSPASSVLYPALPDSSSHCDTLKMNSGEKILVLITEVTPEQVKYRTCDYPDGPIHIVLKNKVSSIHYASGLLREFSPKKEENIQTAPRQDNSSPPMSDGELEYLVKKKTNLSFTTGILTWVSTVLYMILLFFSPIQLLLTLALVFAVIALLSGKRALRLLEGNRQLEALYHHKARMGKLLGSVFLWLLLILAVLGIILVLILYAALL
ncbi:MAG TPA: hypothetical protein VNZ86_15690 [Bacteroidia bacterium]|nr:hypothetical protein [Bacteroidia bacterium]